jgi:hypothetical protein
MLAGLSKIWRKLSAASFSLIFKPNWLNFKETLAFTSLAAI